MEDIDARIKNDVDLEDIPKVRKEIDKLIGDTSVVSDRAKELFDMYVNDENFILDYETKKLARYSVDEDKVIINPIHNKWVHYTEKHKAIIHEITHMIDTRENISVGNMRLIDDNMKKARELILDNKGEYENLFTKDIYRDNMSLSDVFDNLTNGEVKGKYWHEKGYYDKMLGARELELVAGLMTEYIADDKLTLDIYNEIPPLKNILERLIKAYGYTDI